MLRVLGFIGVIVVGFMVWSVVEAISADRRRIRTLSKPVWVLLILLLPLAGAIAWFVYARPQASPAVADGLPRADRARSKDASNPAHEAADYSERLRERAEEQRRRYEQQKNKDKDTPDVE